MVGESANRDAVLKKKVLQARLADLQRSRAGQIPTSEPNQHDIMNMEHAFRNAPNNRKAKERFSKTLSPEQYLLYLKSQKNMAPSNVPRKNQTAISMVAHCVVDAQTQTERPAFVMPKLRPMPKAALKKPQLVPCEATA